MMIAKWQRPDRGACEGEQAHLATRPPGYMVRGFPQPQEKICFCALSEHEFVRWEDFRDRSRLVLNLKPGDAFVDTSDMNANSLFQNRLQPVRLLLFLSLNSLLLGGEEFQPRVFVSDSNSWEVRGALFGSEGGVFGGLKGGSRPQTAEVIKNFDKSCEQVIVTVNPERADYFIRFEREGGKGLLRRDNKIAVFDWRGDVVFSGSTVTVGGAVKDACEAIVSHAQTAARRSDTRPSTPPASSAASKTDRLSSADRPKYHSSRDFDGIVWNSLRQGEKMTFLAGHQSAMEEVYLQMTSRLDLSAALPAASALVAASKHEQERRAAILQQVESTIASRLEMLTPFDLGMGELLQRLDDFYKDSSLLRVPIVEAVQVVAMEKSGASSREIRIKKASLRSRIHEGQQ